MLALKLIIMLCTPHTLSSYIFGYYPSVYSCSCSAVPSHTRGVRPWVTGKTLKSATQTGGLCGWTSVHGHSFAFGNCRAGSFLACTQTRLQIIDIERRLSCKQRLGLGGSRRETDMPAPSCIPLLTTEAEAASPARHLNTRIGYQNEVLPTLLSAFSYSCEAWQPVGHYPSGPSGSEGHDLWMEAHAVAVALPTTVGVFLVGHRLGSNLG